MKEYRLYYQSGMWLITELSFYGNSTTEFEFERHSRLEDALTRINQLKSVSMFGVRVL